MLLRLIGSPHSGEGTDVCDGRGEPILVAESTYIGRRTDQYRFIPSSYIRLLRCVGIKVADEYQISLDYVRGSNIYVRGHLDLRTWPLRLRT